MAETQNDNQTQVDPWEAAFAALDKETSKASEEDTDTGEDGGQEQPPKEDVDSEGTVVPEAGNDDEVEDIVGGSGDTSGTDDIQDEYDADIHIEQEDIDNYKTQLENSIEEQTLRDVAAAYIKQGARHTNGRLGATINDSDICKRDSDGVPHYYNPETGREFNGDNPRRQAQEWCDDYNKELADAFNKTCEGYAKRLLDEQGHGLTVLEFAPKYEKLDDVRKSMFDSIIEDYEILDKNGDIIGYSCDLDRALNAVNRQVRIIQERFHQANSQQKEEPSGPALDMKSSGKPNNNNERPEFKSIAEAMEWEQDQLLKKMKERK